MTIRRLIQCMLAACLVPLAGSALADEFTDEFPLADCNFRTTGQNPFFPIQPGAMSFFSNANCVADLECDELEELVITVLGETHMISMEIDGKMHNINTRIIEEYETVEGELAEISRNYFAMCGSSGDVYYFGESVDIYEDGELVGHEGEWEAGVDGAMPGIIMPGGAILLGSRYYQEIAAEAQDRAEHVAVGEEAEVPAGVFEDCIEVIETTPLEPGEESEKIYCRGVGLVFDDDLELLGTN